ncbi:MAG: helix-turn-helix domain-containing protein [Clostridia bacterium]|nr:helix-turn-helix domain-containing protein [Clostridia bacterium]
MSLKLFQVLIHQVREIIDAEFGLMDETGMIFACSNEERIGQYDPRATKVIQSREQFTISDGFTYQKVYIRNKLEFISFIASNDANSTKQLSLFSVNVVNLKSYNDEKFDKANFIKNIIVDNVLPGDILLRAKELHLDYNSFRVALLVKTEKTKDVYVHDIIEGLFPNKAKDFVIILDDENVVLIKELKINDDYKETEKAARAIIDTLQSELMIKAYIGIGTIVDNIKDLGRSFKEAQMALLIGRIFENEKSIINYNSLGIGRLIYQIPRTLCELFLKEVFKESSFEALDTETLFTIQKFFENNLNVSEASRQLYVHRNTLVYRLDKIQKLTGLDLRNFDDAIIFKVAMLVKKYLDKNDNIL